MLNPAAFAVHLAHALELFRTQAPKEEQKQEFRILVGLLKDGGVLMSVAAGRLLVNGTPVDLPQVKLLTERLRAHAVTEMVVPHDAPVAHVYELLKALSEPPARSASLSDRLKATGSSRLSVSLKVDLPLEPPPPAGLVETANPEIEVPPELLGTQGLLRGDPMQEFESQMVAGTTDIIKETEDETPAVLPRTGRPDAPPPPPPPALMPMADLMHGELFAATTARTRTTDAVLAELAHNPTASSVQDTLAVLLRQVEVASHTDKIEDALRIVDGIIRIEGEVPEDVRRPYSIAMKRVLTRDLLQAFAHLAGAPVHRDTVLRVLARGGDDGVAILLEQLASASSVDERRSLFFAVSQMKSGQDELVHMLNHNQWFVVRNVAELLGELALEGSAQALSQQLAHPDERVRGAVALALAKIGSAGLAGVVEPLRRALRDPAAGVRMQVAFGVGGRRAGALAMPIVLSIEQEQDPEVARELMLALGRIGSPDAVQALIKLAQPGGKLFGRKPASRRLAAVEALRVAATPAAIGTLQGLVGDSEKEIKSAARAALAELKR